MTADERAIRAALYPSLAGKRAVVVGGSRGIGRAISLRLAAEGCHVLVNYARDAEAAEATAAECRDRGVEAEALRADAGNREELAALFARAAEWGGVDLLVNNAARGLERPRPAIAQRPGHLHATMDVNLFGPWQAAQAAVPLMEERGGGGIVNLLSPGAWQYMPDYSAVAVSKAALASLTRYLAVELAPRGIRVNAVSAGWVEASEGEHSYRGGVSDAVRPHVPAGRNVAPRTSPPPSPGSAPPKLRCSLARQSTSTAASASPPGTRSSTRRPARTEPQSPIRGTICSHCVPCAPHTANEDSVRDNDQGRGIVAVNDDGNVITLSGDLAHHARLTTSSRAATVSSGSAGGATW